MRTLVILCAALGLAKTLDITYDGFEYDGEVDSMQNLAQVETEAEIIGDAALDKKLKDLEVAEEGAKDSLASLEQAKA